MSKTIQIDDDTYEFLVNKTRKKESFAQTLRRILRLRSEEEPAKPGGDAPPTLVNLVRARPYDPLQAMRDAGIEVIQSRPDTPPSDGEGLNETA